MLRHSRARRRDATFAAYGDEETAGDVVALIGELGGPAVVVGNSMSAGSAVLAASRLRRPGPARAFSLTTRMSHTAAEAQLTAVTAPALILMGDQGPDFPDPQAEAAWIARALGGQIIMVPEAGHYPQSQQPDITTRVVLGFLQTVHGRAEGRTGQRRGNRPPGRHGC